MNTNTGRILKSFNISGDYSGIRLSKNGTPTTFRVQRIVARAFPEICGEWFEGCVINHKNEIKTDNRACNLEVCTYKHNANWGTANERRKTKLVNRSDKSKHLTQYTLEGIFLKPFSSVREAARETGIDQASISRCCRGEQSQAGGYIWRYV